MKRHLSPVVRHLKGQGGNATTLRCPCCLPLSAVTASLHYLPRCLHSRVTYDKTPNIATWSEHLKICSHVIIVQNVWFKANNTILLVIPPLKAQMTICSKHLRRTWPRRPLSYVYACRQRSGHERTASSALHDTRTVNLALAQCECHTGN